MSEGTGRGKDPSVRLLGLVLWTAAPAAACPTCGPLVDAGISATAGAGWATLTPLALLVAGALAVARSPRSW